MAQIKFYRSSVAPTNPQEGAIWFNVSNRTIQLYKSNAWEIYTSIIDASFNDNKLEITKHTGAKVTVDLSDMASKSVLDTLSDNFDQLKTNFDTLVGSDTNKSVRTIANEELAAQLLAGPDGAVDNFNTLQQLAAWLEEHPESAAAMNEAIATNSANISTLTTDVNNLKAIDHDAYKADIAAINTTIEENELTIASALTDLDTRINNLSATESVASVSGQDYILTETVDNVVVVKADIGSISNEEPGLALAADVKEYVDSTFEWASF